MITKVPSMLQPNTTAEAKSRLYKIPSETRKGAVRRPTNPPQKWIGNASIGSSTVREVMKQVSEPFVKDELNHHLASFQAKNDRE